MKFRDQNERKETLEIMDKLLSPLKEKASLKEQKAIELSLRILNDTEVFKEVEYIDYCDL